jgi:hypothetical protein
MGHKNTELFGTSFILRDREAPFRISAVTKSRQELDLTRQE